MKKSYYVPQTEQITIETGMVMAGSVIISNQGEP